jgi:serine/threonine protein kinase
MVTQPQERTVEKIGRYEIVEKVGEGAFSDVYKARDPVIGRQVALKVMKDESFNLRLKVEANRMGMVSGHPNVLGIYDVGTFDTDTGRTLDCLVLELGDTSLRKEIDDGKTKGNWRSSVEHTIQMLDALQAIHEKTHKDEPCVHRDLKPSNILLKDGKVKLGDFGLVTDDECAEFMSSIMQSGIPTGGSDEGNLMGTFPYMAPEQKRGSPITPVANVYQVGQILTELITGKRIDELGMGRTVSSEAKAPKWLDKVIADATEFMPENRYQSAKEMAAQLRKGLEGAFDGPTAAQRAWGIAKIAGKVITSPFWGPVWLWRKGDECWDSTEFGLKAASVILGAVAYAGTPIAGMVEYEKHMEGKTRADAEQVFAAQPEDLCIAYQTDDGINLARVRTLLTERPEIRTLPISKKIYKFLGAKDDSLIFTTMDDKTSGGKTQIYGFDLQSNELKPIVDYSNPENDWLKTRNFYCKDSGSEESGCVSLVTNPDNGISIRINEKSKNYVVNERGHVLYEPDSVNWRVVNPENRLQNSDLIINESFGDNVQFYHRDDFWGDLEMFPGNEPVLVRRSSPSTVVEAE